MASFANLTANLNLNIQNFASNIRRAARLANQFSANLNGQINDGLVEPAKKSKFEFKDVARIVQGIMISKAFYGGLNAIRNATDAVFSFSQELESAQIAYSNLFGSTTLASNFINVLQDFAAKTPFSFQQSEEAARRLLSYGIQYKNVMYVMKGVLAASSMTGNPQTVESISRAIGQIYTKGRLMNEEMRQLAEAGVPAYQILQQKLGLTQKQLQNLGKNAIPASVAINALVDGLQQRFGNVTQAASMTVTGIMSNIKDNAQMLASTLFGPTYNTIKSFLYSIEQQFEKLRTIGDTRGAGGVFEALVPPQYRETIRAFIANLKSLFVTLMRLKDVFKEFAMNVMMQFIRVFNLIGPPIIYAVDVLARMLQIITGNKDALNALTGALVTAATMWMVFKAKALAATAIEVVIKTIGKVSKGLDALSLSLVRHPILTVLGLIAGAFLLVALSSRQAQSALSSFFGTLSGINGIKADKVLLPSQKKRTADLQKFNNALNGTKDGMDALADSTGKAKKAGEQLMSFDEVYSVKNPDETSTAGANDLGLGNLDASSLIPDIPDFTDFANQFVNDLSDAVKDKLVNAGFGMLIGAGLGAAIGGIIGGPGGAILGSKIGLFVGGLVGLLWDKMDKQMKDTITGAAIGTAVGAAIGGILGGPGGVAIGAGIGTFVGGLGGYFWEQIKKSLGLSDTQGLSIAIGTGLGAAIGACVGGPAGAAIGAGIGILVGWIIGKFVDSFNQIGNYFKVDLPNQIASDLSNIWLTVQKAFNIDNWQFESLPEIGINIVNGIFTGIVAAVASVGTLLWDLLVKPIIDGIKSLFGIHSPATTMYEVGDQIVAGIFEGIKESIDSFVTNLGQFKDQVVQGFSSWTDETKTKFSTWSTDTYNNLSGWFTNTKTTLGNWWNDTKGGFDNWKTDTGTKISTWGTDAKNNVSNWYNDTKTRLSDWWNTSKIGFGTWSTDTGTKIAGWVTAAKTNISSWKDDTFTKISSWWDSTKTGFATNASDIQSSVQNWLDMSKVSMSSWFEDTKKILSNWWSDTQTGFESWGKSIWNTVSNWVGKAISKIQDFFSARDEAASSASRSSSKSTSKVTAGHAYGGIFNKEHIARFAEGNKAEAVIPLENEEAMAPFVDAVAGRLMQYQSGYTVEGNNDSFSSITPMLIYAGTVVADEASLKKLARKIRIIELGENDRILGQGVPTV